MEFVLSDGTNNNSIAAFMKEKLQVLYKHRYGYIQPIPWASQYKFSLHEVFTHPKMVRVNLGMSGSGQHVQDEIWWVQIIRTF